MLEKAGRGAGRKKASSSIASAGPITSWATTRRRSAIWSAPYEAAAPMTRCLTTISAMPTGGSGARRRRAFHGSRALNFKPEPDQVGQIQGKIEKGLQSDTGQEHAAGRVSRRVRFYSSAASSIMLARAQDQTSTCTSPAAAPMDFTCSTVLVVFAETGDEIAVAPADGLLADDHRTFRRHARRR